MAKLNEFLASINGEGLMRSSRFSVDLTLPNAISQGGYTNNLRKVLLYCDTINLPGLSFATAEAKTFGEIREMPYQRLFETVNMTFYVDNSMGVKLLFDSWMASVIDPIDRTFNYYDDYRTNMNINVYDINDKSRYQVILHECYPKAIGAIQMDYANKDVMKLNVTMIVKYWESHGAKQQQAGGNITTVNNNSPQYFTQNLGDPTQIPSTYFTNFNSFQTGFNSFEQSRASLFSSETASVGRGSTI